MVSWNLYTSIEAILYKLDVLQATLMKVLTMANALDTQIMALQQSVANLTTAEASAVALIGGFSAQLAAATAAALAQGATAAELQSLTDLKTAIDANSSGLAAAVAANTTPVAATPAKP